MNVADILHIYDRLWFLGECPRLENGRHDLRLLAAQAVARLPPDVRDWLLNVSMPLFVAGNGQPGEYAPFCIHPDERRLPRHGNGWLLPVVSLSERLMDVAKEEALWVIALQVARMRLYQESGGLKDDREAAQLATAWGFRKAPSTESRSKVPQASRGGRRGRTGKGK